MTTRPSQPNRTLRAFKQDATLAAKRVAFLPEALLGTDLHSVRMQRGEADPDLLIDPCTALSRHRCDSLDLAQRGWC